MRRILLLATVLGLALIVGVGCSGKNEPAPQNPAATTQLPAGHPTVPGGAQPTGKPVDVKEVEEKVTKALNEKFPGDWQAAGTTLKKGAYTENNNYGIVDEVAKLYQGSMVSIFVGQERISSNVKGQDGKPVLANYQVPEEVGKTMTSGKATVSQGGSMGAVSYQKVYLPLKAGDKTLAVMSVSIAQ
jgi:hypothetical protein